MNHFQYLLECKCLFIAMKSHNLILNLFAIHFGIAEIAQDRAELLSRDLATLFGIIEFESIFYLVFLDKYRQYHIFREFVGNW